MDGVLIDPKTREKSEPRASAGNDGTTITVCVLFYQSIVDHISDTVSLDRRPIL
jgi:hypothetical protein